MLRNTNPIVSIYRSTTSVDMLRRVNYVTGTEFPVSGDAPLRESFKRRTAQELAEYDAGKERIVGLFGNYTEAQENPC